MAEGANAEALRLVLYCVEHGVERDPAFLGLWGTELQRVFGELSRRYPPAAVEAERHARIYELNVMRSDDAGERFLLGLVTLRRTRQEQELLSQFFDMLSKSDQVPAARKGELLTVVIEAVDGLGRFDVIAENAEAILASECAMLDYTSGPGRNEMRLIYLRHTSLVYHALLVTGGAERARRVADDVTEDATTIDSFMPFVRAAGRAGSRGEALRLVARAASKLAPEDVRLLGESVEAH